jgi:DNA-binding IclR family transcriptional regulator
LPVYTARTPDTVAALKTLISADRTAGYGISQGGFETGISTLAAPVFNDQTAVVAAVSITVPAQQLSDAQVVQLLPLVRAAAAQLTQRLSHLPTRGQQPAFAETLTA